MKKTFKRILVLLLTVTMMMSMASVSTFAATKKTVKKSGFVTDYTKINKVSTKLKKRGTYRLTVKGSEGYIRFKAPKTKKYTFTFSNISVKDNYNSSCGSIAVQKPYKSNGRVYLTLADVKTQGGKSDFLKVKTRRFSLTGDGVNAYRTTRSCKVKMKKGAYIYFHVNIVSTKNTVLTLKIK